MKRIFFFLLIQLLHLSKIEKRSKRQEKRKYKIKNVVNISKNPIVKKEIDQNKSLDDLMSDDENKMLHYIRNRNFCMRKIKGVPISVLLCKKNNVDDSNTKEYELHDFLLTRREITKLKKHYNICGFINTENTCYANIIFQIIFEFPGFFNFLQRNYYCNKNLIIRSLYSLAMNYQGEETYKIDTIDFQKIFKKQTSEFFDGNMHDSIIFLMRLMKNIYESNFENQESVSYMEDAFFVLYVEEKKCLNCQNTDSEQIEDFIVMATKKNISNGLDNIFCPEILNTNCVYCKCNRILYTYSLKKYPNILIVNTNDMHSPDSSKNTKIGLENSININGNTYLLLAYLVFLQSVTDITHSICIVKKNDVWFFFDDDKIYVVNNPLNPPIYPSVLFYVKIIDKD